MGSCFRVYSLSHHKLKILGYLKDSNAAEQSVDSDSDSSIAVRCKTCTLTFISLSTVKW